MLRVVPFVTPGAPMNPIARDRLRELITASGVEVFQTPRVLEVQVSQALHDLPAERDALVQALRHGFVESIRKEPTEIARLAGEMKTRTGMTEADTGWALESWRELMHGVRSKSLNRADAYLAHEKTRGMSFRPPTRDQFGRSGIIAGILAGLLVGAFWGGVKAVSLGRTIHRAYTVDSYRGYNSMQVAYRGGNPQYQRYTLDLEFTEKGIVAWLGWIVAGALIGSVAGGTSALYLSHGSMKFVGGYSGAIVGAVAGLANGQRLIHIGPVHGASFSDIFAQALASVLVGVLVGVILGGFRDLFLNFRSDMPNPIFRTLFRFNWD
jgi:hypothetical protein